MTRNMPAWIADHPNLARIAGAAAIAAPIVWAAVVAVELAHANIGHSIIARPERFFSDSAWHLPLVLLVTAMAGCAGIAVASLTHGERGRVLAVLTAAVLAGGLAARLGLALLLPSDPHGYTVSGTAALSAYAFLIASPSGLLLTAGLIRRRSAGLAWISAATGILIVFIAVWAYTWAARSGATQPELLAVEPADGLLCLWSAAVGAWILDVPARLATGRAMPRIPAPGGVSAVAFALVLVIGVAAMSIPFFNAYESTIDAQLRGRAQVESIHADTVDRTYRVYTPYEIDRPNLGLVIVLHGSFGDGFQIESSSGFDAQADRLGWIAVYPDGVADGWDAFGSGPAWGLHPGADDVVFMRALIAHFEAVDNVDPNRVYITGHSRGGMMSYRLGCEMADVVAAIAPVSGNMATADGSADVPCHPARPISVMATHGTADGTIPMAGGKVDIVFSPMADVIGVWRALDGCVGATDVAAAGGVTTTTWNCAAGTNVVTRIIGGGCHCWSGGDSRAIADFFVAHPRR